MSEQQRTEAAPRVLLVEDDDVSGALLGRYLALAEFEVSQAATCTAALDHVRRRRPELVLVDIGLPDGDGVALAAELRRIADPAIIFVTGRDDDDARVHALELAGDDYVTKPVDHRELLARIRAVLRRHRGTAAGAGQARRFGPWRLELEQRRLLHGSGQVVALTRGEYDLLARLVTAQGRVVGRIDLYAALGGRGSDTGERTVDALVSRLRRKLAAVEPGLSVIETVPALGYRLAHGML